MLKQNKNMRNKPLNIDFFFLDSGAEDWHDIVITLSDNNQDKFVEINQINPKDGC